MSLYVLLWVPHFKNIQGAHTIVSPSPPPWSGIPIHVAGRCNVWAAPEIPLIITLWTHQILSIQPFSYPSRDRLNMGSSSSSTKIDAKGIARRTILQYLQTTRCAERFPPNTPPPIVEAKVTEVINSWNLPIPKEKSDKYRICGIHFGYAPYQHTPYEVQIAAALFTFCTTIYDDAALDIEAMREFVPRWCEGKPQLDPFLDRFVETTMALREFFPPYAANTICSSTMEYGTEEVYNVDEAPDAVFTTDSWQYIEYARLKGGIAEPYAILIWPSSICPNVSEWLQALPDAQIYVNHVNDLLSFYKEALVEEGEDMEDNYISRYSKVHGKGIEETVDIMLEKILTTGERIERLLGDGPAKEAWLDFVAGYTHFHIYSPRYKLQEVLPEYF